MHKKTYVVRKKKRGATTRQSARSSKTAQPASLPDRATSRLSPVRIVWSLIDFETCRPVVTDVGEVKLGETAHHAIDVEGCLGGVFQFKDAMGIVGTLVAFPGMHPEAFVQKFDRGDADEFTYIVKDGVKEFAAVVKEEA